MSAVARVVEPAPVSNDEFAAMLNDVLVTDQLIARRALAGNLCDPSVFAALSDLELACAYEYGDSDLEDALYCELHRRGLTPWKFLSQYAVEAT